MYLEYPGGYCSFYTYVFYTPRLKSRHMFEEKKFNFFFNALHAPANALCQKDGLHLPCIILHK
jgi:hypothetical protein